MRLPTPRPAALLVTAVLLATAPGGTAAADVAAPPAAAPDGSAAGVVAELPAQVQDDLTAGAAERLDGSAAGAGPVATVAVATTREDGRMEVSTVDVRAAAAPGVVDVLEDLPSVRAASVDGVVTAFDETPSPLARIGSLAASADPLRREQWGLGAVGAEALRSRATGVPVVAVLDSGVDGGHEDLRGVVLRGTDLVTPGGDGWADANGHGTHVAGTVSATVGNGLGGEGVVVAQILPVRVLDGSGTGSTSSIAKGVVWAADAGADVVNLSLGTTASDPVVEQALAYAVRRGVVLVAAMGNQGLTGSPVSYPAASPDVLAVAALTPDLERADYSSQGAHADLAAPGSEVLSTWRGNGYRYASGTSMAAPHVAAAAAALVASSPRATPQQVADALVATADDLGAPGHDVATGYGLVDPTQALAVLRARVAGSPTSSQCLASTAPLAVAQHHR